jgi:hypothetical protein
MPSHELVKALTNLRRKQSRGAIRNLAVVNSGGDALTVLGGEWEVDNCRVQSRGECALSAANQSVVHLRESLIGGSAARPVASRHLLLSRYWPVIHTSILRGRLHSVTLPLHSINSVRWAGLMLPGVRMQSQELP